MGATDHYRFVRKATVCALIAAVAAAAGCGGSGDVDKSGVEARADPVKLVLANHDGGAKDVQAWADAVARLSNGSIRIRIARNWREGETNYEEATLADVRSGKVELAKIAARAFDDAGVTTFQPLVAPLLIDSRQLERRVLRDEVAKDALAGTAKLGLVGLALLPTDLRRPIGISRVLVSPDDFAGARVYTREGAVGRATLRALGAEAVHKARNQWFEGVNGGELSLGAVRAEPEIARRAAITANVVLWPQPVTIVMNEDAFNRLAPAQQEALRKAGDEVFEAQTRLQASLQEEDRAVLCRMGARFVEATPAQLAAFQAAVPSVYRTIERGEGNRATLDRIRQLKAGVEAEVLSCGAAETSEVAANPDTSQLEGTYRTSFGEQELADSPFLQDEGEVNDGNWGEFTLALSDGNVRLEQRNEQESWATSGRYVTDGDAIELHFDDLGETWAYRWSLYRGTLKFERDSKLGVPPERHSPTSFLVKPWRRAQ